MRPPKENRFVGFRPKCVMCGNEIPADHPKPKTAKTCSDKCRDDRKEYMRTADDAVRCQYCFKPSSLAQRARFRRWRNWEKLNPPPDDQLDPVEIAEREARKLNPPQKRGPRAKVKTEEPDAAAVQD